MNKLLTLTRKSDSVVITVMSEDIQFGFSENNNTHIYAIDSSNGSFQDIIVTETLQQVADESFSHITLTKTNPSQSIILHAERINYVKELGTTRLISYRGNLGLIEVIDTLASIQDKLKNLTNKDIAWGDIVLGSVSDQTDLQAELDLKEDVANRGAANGYVPLNASTLIDAQYLPSFVDEILEFADFASFPATGDATKIYVDLSTSKIYRWGGTAYSEITDSTAVWGSISGTLTNQTDLNNALALKENLSNKGVANGYVPLNGSTLIDAQYLPSYVDDVVEYPDLASFPITGISGTIYIDLSTGQIFRWSGSAYIQIAVGSQSVIYDNQVFLSSDSGNDATGLVGDVSRPFKTLQAAVNAAVEGNSIIIIGGTYTEGASLSTFNSGNGGSLNIVGIGNVQFNLSPSSTLEYFLAFTGNDYNVKIENININSTSTSEAVIKGTIAGGFLYSTLTKIINCNITSNILFLNGHITAVNSTLISETYGITGTGTKMYFQGCNFKLKNLGGGVLRDSIFDNCVMSVSNSTFFNVSTTLSDKLVFDSCFVKVESDGVFSISADDQSVNILNSTFYSAATYDLFNLNATTPNKILISNLTKSTALNLFDLSGGGSDASIESFNVNSSALISDQTLPVF